MSGRRATKAKIVGNKILVSSLDLKEHLTCSLCQGLLVDPFTVKECVHSFCKSCIFKFVSVNPKCPKCSTRLSSNPFDLLSPDRTLQALLIKCFPDVTASISANERAFNEKYSKRGRDDEDFVVDDDFNDMSLSKAAKIIVPPPLTSPASAPAAHVASATVAKEKPPVEKMTKEIRFRLQNPDILIDKKVVFNAPRDSKLKRVVPFLTRWLEQKGHPGAQLTFLKNGAIVDQETTFVALFGKTMGTQTDPAVLDFVLQPQE